MPEIPQTSGQPVQTQAEVLSEVRAMAGQLNNIEARLIEFSGALHKFAQSTENATLATRRLRLLLGWRYVIAYAAVALTVAVIAAVALSHLFVVPKDPEGKWTWFFLASEGLLVVVVGMLLWTYVALSRNE